MLESDMISPTENPSQHLFNKSDRTSKISVDSVTTERFQVSKNDDIYIPLQTSSEYNIAKLDDAKLQERSRFLEIKILLWRTGVNLLRNRSLFQLHLLMSVVLGLAGGFVFSNITNDLAGFQTRTGAFFFILTFFGFSSLSSMDLFINEQSIYLKEISKCICHIGRVEC